MAANKEGVVTKTSLAKLRTRLKKLKMQYKVAQGRIDITKARWIYLEDVLAAKARKDGIKRIPWSLKEESTEWDYKWHTFYRPLLVKLVAVLCLGLSVLCYLGVAGAMAGYGTRVSVYATVLHSRNTDGVAAIVIIIVGLGYA